MFPSLQKGRKCALPVLILNTTIVRASFLFKNVKNSAGLDLPFILLLSLQGWDCSLCPKLKSIWECESCSSQNQNPPLHKGRHLSGNSSFPLVNLHAYLPLNKHLKKSFLRFKCVYVCSFLESYRSISSSYEINSITYISRLSKTNHEILTNISLMDVWDLTCLKPFSLKPFFCCPPIALISHITRVSKFHQLYLQNVAEISPPLHRPPLRRPQSLARATPFSPHNCFLQSLNWCSCFCSCGSTQQPEWPFFTCSSQIMACILSKH